MTGTCPTNSAPLAQSAEVMGRRVETGVLRVPVAIFQLTGAVPADAPNWYVVFQGLIGLAQFAIGLAMPADYRRPVVRPVRDRHGRRPAWR